MYRFESIKPGKILDIQLLFEEIEDNECNYLRYASKVKQCLESYDF